MFLICAFGNEGIGSRLSEVGLTSDVDNVSASGAFIISSYSSNLICVIFVPIFQQFTSFLNFAFGNEGIAPTSSEVGLTSGVDNPPASGGFIMFIYSSN